MTKTGEESNDSNSSKAELASDWAAAPGHKRSLDMNPVRRKPPLIKGRRREGHEPCDASIHWMNLFWKTGLAKVTWSGRRNGGGRRNDLPLTATFVVDAMCYHQSQRPVVCSPPKALRQLHAVAFSSFAESQSPRLLPFRQAPMICHAVPGSLHWVWTGGVLASRGEK